MSNLLNYFVHGIVWSIAYIFLAFAWVFMLVVLVFTGLLLGLIIGFFLLFILMGVVNVAITNAIWDTGIESNWKGDFFQGLVLFIALILADIPNLIISSIVPGPITLIFLFVLYCFIDGFIAKSVATGIATSGEA